MRRAGAALLFGMLWFFGCGGPPLQVAPNAAETVAQEEIQLCRQAREAEAVLEKSGRLYGDLPLEAYLDEIVRKMAPRPLPPHIDLRVRVIENPSMNALAFPDGAIYVHTGLLAKADNEAQVAALLAHELVHCLHHHVWRYYQALRTAGFSPSRPDAGLASLVARTLDALPGYAGARRRLAGLGRALEMEADREGTRLLILAGYDGAEALKLLNHLQAEQVAGDASPPQFLESHPPVADRIAVVTDVLGRASAAAEGDETDNDAYHEMIAPLLLCNARLDLAAGRLFSARQAIEKYLSLHPRDAHAYFLLGEAGRKRGCAEGMADAKACYSRAIAIDPLYAEPRKAIGLVYFKEGNRLMARSAFETCLALAPRIPGKAFIEDYLRQCRQ